MANESDDKVAVTLRIEQSELKRVDHLAAVEGISRNEWLRRLLQQFNDDRALERYRRERSRELLLRNLLRSALLIENLVKLIAPSDGAALVSEARRATAAYLTRNNLIDPAPQVADETAGGNS